MCCLFGLIDPKGSLTGGEKHRIFSALARAGESRGSDATGFACSRHGKITIEKQPLPAHRMRFHIPGDAHILMGHTRMTTQGSEKKNRNNHPFFGKTADTAFALAHNGVLYNDASLRKKYQLPQSKIETDSYIAVQLIEHQKALNLDSLRWMAEQIRGSFAFSVLDHQDRLYLVKGSSPLHLLHFPDSGVYLYASTQAVLQSAVTKSHLSRIRSQEIQIDDGDMLMFSPDGTIQWDCFLMSHYPTNPLGMLADCSTYGEDLQFVLDFGESIGVPREELEYLWESGFDVDEIELAAQDRHHRMMCLLCAGYYDEMEGNENGYDPFEDLPWTEA